jgi:opacity protein-like surface antigen
MKINLLSGIAITAIALCAVPAHADDMAFKPYVSVFGGGSFLNNISAAVASYSFEVDMDAGYLLGGAVGVNFNDLVRGEFEFSHANWGADNYTVSFSTPSPDFKASAAGDVSATFLLANVWLDLANNSPFTPYMGGGLGLGLVDGDTFFNGGTNGFGDGNSGFAFQLGGGVKLDITDHASIDFAYRYKSILGVEFKDQISPDVYKDADLNSHNIQVGLTYRF